MTAAIPQRDALKLQLAAIAGNEPPSSFFELRPFTPEVGTSLPAIEPLSRCASLTGRRRESSRWHPG